MAPGLARTPQNQGLFLIILVAMASIGSAGLVYSADTCCSFSPAHPLQVFGICTAPAQLQQAGGIYAGIGSHLGCFRTQVENVTLNGQNTQIVATVPAGTFEYVNGSVASP